MTSHHKGPVLRVCVCCQRQAVHTQFVGLMQERRYSMANALELRFSCTNPSNWLVGGMRHPMLMWHDCWMLQARPTRTPPWASTVMEGPPQAHNKRTGTWHMWRLPTAEPEVPASSSTTPTYLQVSMITDLAVTDDISSAACDDKLGIMTTLNSQCF